MISNSRGGTRPESIQSCSDDHTLKHQIIHMGRIYGLPSNVLTLTIGALKRNAQMITRACLLEANLILEFRQRCTVEISWHLDVKVVERMAGKARSAPSVLTNREMSSAQAIVCADDTRLEGHLSLTSLTRQDPGLPLSAFPF